jgi:hypothetical protein
MPLVLASYEATKPFPREEIFGLVLIIGPYILFVCGADWRLGNSGVAQ